MSTRSTVVVLLSALWAFQTPQQPTIRSGVELVLVDVQVTSKDGTPMHALKADQFDVTIDGKKRPVVNLDFIKFGEGGTPTVAPGVVPADTSPAGLSREGRVIVIGVDQASLAFGAEPAAREAVTRLVAMANPEDAIGLFGVPEPGVSVSPTRDRAAILGALGKIGGQLSIPRTRLVVSLPEAVDASAGDRHVWEMLEQRECPPMRPGVSSGGCGVELKATVQEIAMTFEAQAIRSINGIHSLMSAVQGYPGRKIVVLISAGFPTTDRTGGRPDIKTETTITGRRAAEANAVLYSLRLDVGFLMAFSAANAGRSMESIFRHSRLVSSGLERLTGAAGGTLIDVPVGPDPALKRLLRETSSYYLLGVEALPEHRDGKTHFIQVKVKQGEVRARNAVVIPKAQ